MPRLLSRRPLRRPFVVTLAVAALGGCSGAVETGPAGTAVDASPSHNPPVVSHNPPAAILDASVDGDCPSFEPAQGAPCTGGAVCSYPSVDCPASDTATCQGGAWEVLDVGCSHNPPAMARDASPPPELDAAAPPRVDAQPERRDAASACPVSEPASGTACETAPDEACKYPSGECPGFSDSAVCQAGVWEVAGVGCSHNPPAMDAAID